MISILVIYLSKKYYHKLNKKSSIKEVNGQIKLGINMVKEDCFAYEEEVEEYSERLKYKKVR